MLQLDDLRQAGEAGTQALKALLVTTVQAKGGSLTPWMGNGSVIRRLYSGSLISHGVPSGEWNMGGAGYSSSTHGTAWGSPEAASPNNPELVTRYAELQNIAGPSAPVTSGSWVYAYPHNRHAGTLGMQLHPKGAGPFSGIELALRRWEFGGNLFLRTDGTLKVTSYSAENSEWVIRCSGTPINLVTTGPGFVFCHLPLQSLVTILQSGGTFGARLVRSMLNRGINSAYRSANAAFDFAGHVTGVGAWERAGDNSYTTELRTRQRSHRMHHVKLVTSKRDAIETIARVDTALKGKAFVSDPKDALDKAIKLGNLKGWKVTPSGWWLHFPAQVISCDEVEWDGSHYESGVYETPEMVLMLPKGFKCTLDWAKAVRCYQPSGSAFPHPHIMGGATLCWGETPTMTSKNQTLGLELWLTSPDQFCEWIFRMFGSYYGEGTNGGTYHPFQQWARRVRATAEAA